VLAKDMAGRERFGMMERKLFAIMSIGAVGTVVFGLWLLTKIPADLGAGWMHAKLTLVVVLLGYHIWLGMLCRRFRNNLDSHGHVFYRWINEIPALFLITIVILAVVKPF
jgi:putative membrane protein